MQPTLFQTILTEPEIPTGNVRDNLVLYPDYLVSLLLKQGVGRIEAERSQMKDGKVEFVHTDWKEGRRQIVGRLELGDFRAVLARFGVICKVSNLYVSHSFFGCDYQREGQIRSHSFSLFICNEPTMDIWLRLYLYGIAGVSPKIS